MVNYVEAALAPLRNDGQIKLYSPADFQAMHRAGRLVAACLDALRRHWLGRGDAHADVEKQLARRGLRELLALLFFGDAHKPQGLEARLRKLKVKGAVEIYKDCQNGAHEGFAGNLKDMVDRTRALCDELGKVTPP